MLLAAIVLAPIPALADIGWYLGAGAGGTRLEEDLDLTLTASEYDSNGVLTPIASETMDKFNGTDVGFRVFGGIRFGRFFGIEAGYVDLGEPDDDIPLNIPGNTNRPTTDVELKLTDEIDGWEIFALGAFPFADRWEAFAKLGVLNWDSDFKAKNAFADTFPASPPNTPQFIPTVTPESFSESDDGTDLAGGLGFNYQATEHMVLRGEGTWYDIDDTEKVWLLGFSVIINY
jgi:OOP family OmpA-OmpF porin